MPTIHKSFISKFLTPLVLTASALVCCNFTQLPGSSGTVHDCYSGAEAFADQLRFDTLRITFIGDVMQHAPQIKSAAAVAQKQGLPSGSFNYSAMFRHIQSWIDKADIAVANIEFPAGSSGYRGYPLFKGPAEVAIEAHRCGIDLALMANNHMADDGAAGISYTLDLYDSLAMVHTGAFRNISEREKDYPLIMEVCRNVRLAFLNFTYSTNGNPVPEPFIVNAMDSVQVREDLKKASDRGADYIIVLPHWGIEYDLHPSSEQKCWTDMMLRCGADAIIGAHPHVPEDGIIFADSSGCVENIVFYSLGNYISNQSKPFYTQTELMVTLKIQLDKLTGTSRMIEPEWEWLWCFKKGEFEDDYTVVPLSELKALPEEKRAEYNNIITRLENLRDMHLIRTCIVQGCNE